MSAAQTTSSRHVLVRYVVIAFVTALVSILAVAAPSALLEFGVVAAPFLLVALATDVDRFDLEGSYSNPFGPEVRALPLI